jgi:hypothetical protein
MLKCIMLEIFDCHEGKINMELFHMHTISVD